MSTLFGAPATPSQPRGNQAPLFAAGSTTQQQGGSLFSFGGSSTTTTNTTTPATGSSTFTFGGASTNSTAPAGQSSTFSFGGSTSTPTTGQTSAFSFPSSTTSTTQTTGAFNFGGSQQQQQQQQQNAMTPVQEQQLLQKKVSELPANVQTVLINFEAFLAENDAKSKAIREKIDGTPGTPGLRDKNAERAKQIRSARDKLVILREQTELEAKQVCDLRRELSNQYDDGTKAESAAKKLLMISTAGSDISENIKEISLFITQFFGKFEEEAADHLKQLIQTMGSIQATIDGLRSAHAPTITELVSCANAIYESYEAVKKNVASLQQSLSMYEQQQKAADQMSSGMK